MLLHRQKYKCNLVTSSTLYEGLFHVLNKQVKLSFVLLPLWIRCHPVICSINERRLDALQLTRFNVHFHVQCGIKM